MTQEFIFLKFNALGVILMHFFKNVQHKLILL